MLSTIQAADLWVKLQGRTNLRWNVVELEMKQHFAQYGDIRDFLHTLILTFGKICSVIQFVENTSSFILIFVLN